MFVKRHLTDASIYAYAPPSLCSIDGDDEFGAGSIDSMAESIAASLGDDENADPAAVPPVPDSTGDTPPDDTAGADAPPPGEETDPDNLDPASPPSVEPPRSWPADAKEQFKSLPPEAQQIIAERERDRERELRRGQDEIADARKAVEADKAAATHERQRYAQQLDNYIQLTAALDPILAEGSRADWAKMAQEDPAGTQGKWFAFQQRQGLLVQAVQERDRLVHQQQIEHFQREEQALLEKAPEWRADPEKAQTELAALRKTATERYGFRPDEVAIIRDHRIALVMRDALAYHQLVAKQASDKTAAETARKTAEAKRQTTAPARLAPGGGPSDGSGQRIGRAALNQRAADTSLPLEERADAVVALL